MADETAAGEVLNCIYLVFYCWCFMMGSYVTFAVKFKQLGPDQTFHACFYSDIVASVLAFITSAALVKLAASFCSAVEPSSRRLSALNRTEPPVRRPNKPWIYPSRDEMTSGNFMSRDEVESPWPGIPQIRYDLLPYDSFKKERHFDRPVSYKHPWVMSERQRGHRPDLLNVPDDGQHGHRTSRESSWMSYQSLASSGHQGLTASRREMERIQRNLNF